MQNVKSGKIWLIFHQQLLVRTLKQWIQGTKLNNSLAWLFCSSLEGWKPTAGLFYAEQPGVSTSLRTVSPLDTNRNALPKLTEELRAVFLLQRQNPIIKAPSVYCSSSSRGSNLGLLGCYFYKMKWFSFMDLFFPLDERPRRPVPLFFLRNGARRGQAVEDGPRDRWQDEGKWAPVPGVITSPFPEGIQRRRGWWKAGAPLVSRSRCKSHHQSPSPEAEGLAG